MAPPNPPDQVSGWRGLHAYAQCRCSVHQDAGIDPGGLTGGESTATRPSFRS